MILIKAGGGENINWDYICEDIVSLLKKGEKVIVIHGASATRDKIAKKLGIPTKTITSPSGVSSVYTDQKALEVLLMSYCGLVNKRIVGKMQKYGINAIGLSGIDGKVWQAKRKGIVYSVENGKTKLIKGNLSGRVEKVNSDLLNLLINNGYIPVICPPAISFENEIVNTDNDWASAVLCGALGIKKMVVLFEAPGMLKDINNPKSLVKNIKKEELEKYLEFAVGRMKKKILGARKAFSLGIKEIYWGDGRIKHPILNALEGSGTVIQ